MEAVVVDFKRDKFFASIMAPKKKVSKTELRAQKARLRARLSNEIVVGGEDELLEVHIGPAPAQSNESESVETGAGAIEVNPMIDPRVAGESTESTCSSLPADPVLLATEDSAAGPAGRDVNLQRRIRTVRDSQFEVPHLVQVSSALEALGDADVTVTCEDCTDDEAAEMEIRGEVTHALARRRMTGSSSPGSEAVAGDPHGRALKAHVDQLSDEVTDIILQFGNVVIGKRGEEIIRELVKRVDNFLRELTVNMEGPIVDQCKQQLSATKGALVDLLLRADEREAELEMSASNSLRGQATGGGDLGWFAAHPQRSGGSGASAPVLGSVWRPLGPRLLLPVTTRHPERPESTDVTERH